MSHVISQQSSKNYEKIQSSKFLLSPRFTDFCGFDMSLCSISFCRGVQENWISASLCIEAIIILIETALFLKSMVRIKNRIFSTNIRFCCDKIACSDVICKLKPHFFFFFVNNPPLYQKTWLLSVKLFWRPFIPREVKAFSREDIK